MPVHYLQLSSSWLLGLVLLTAAIGKWLDLAWFTSVLKKYDLVPGVTAPFAALAIAVLESIDGGMYFFAGTRVIAAALGLGLFTMFVAAVSINLARGKFDIECGCGSFWKRTKIGWHLVLRNIGMAGLSLLAGWPEREPMRSLSSWLFAVSVLLIAIPLLPSVKKKGCQERHQNESVAAPGPA